MRRMTWALGWTAVVALSGCTQQAAETDAAVTAQVRVEPLGPHPMRRLLQAYGTVEYAPDAQRTITTSAEVIVEQVLVGAGQAVKAGQLLLRVRGTANAALELQKAANDHAAAEQELARVQRLFVQHLTTNADLIAARQNAVNARATAQSAEARIGGTGSHEIHADRDLTVASVDAAPGDTVAANAALMHLASDAQVSVRLGIEPADLGLVKAGQPVVLHPSYAAKTTRTGTIAEVTHRIDAQSHLAQARVALSDAGALLLPGSSVRADIEIDRRDAVLAVPRAAVLRDGEHASVFVTEGRIAKRKPVRTGAEDGTRIEIASGLSSGDRVIVEGNYELEDGMAVSVGRAASMP